MVITPLGIVATSHVQASQAGAQVLARGGSAVDAAIATGHDVLVTAGFFSILHLDFSLNSVAALLLLAGYSINDTVVVFDRLRENRRKYKRMALVDMINLSTNQIATRTTLVSAATALSVVPLLFGGPVLMNFSVAILFGIVVGPFSST